MMRIVPVSMVMVSLLVCSLAARAEENWPQWRGPEFNGSSKAKGLPEKIGPNDNFVWKAVMPGPSSGTPVIWDDMVFVSSLDAASKKLLAIRIDRKTGSEVWRKEVGFGPKANQQHNTMASPSPITDGKHVWFHYATGDLVCFDVDGNQVWTRNLVNDHGSFNFMWIYSSTPLLYKGKLYLQILHNNKPYPNTGGQPGESYLLAIDPATGKDLWRIVRPTEAVNESQESYASPVPFLSSERQEVVVTGGNVLSGHDPETGKELWRSEDWNPGKEQFWRMIASASTGGGRVFACVPRVGNPMLAVQGGGSGTLPFLWMTKDLSTDVCAPLYYNDKLYVLDGDKKTFACADPANGKVLWQGKLDSRPVFRASPTAGDGKIYCMNEAGHVFVLSADKFEVLSQADLGGPVESRASIALADGQVFVRTAEALYCFGAK